MTAQTLPGTISTDELLNVLANRDSRRTLDYLRTKADDTMQVHQLARELKTDEARSVEQLATRLHHAILPKLEDVGAIDHDPRTNTVRYTGHTELEALLDAIQSVPST